MSRVLPANWARAERLYFEGATHLTAIAADCTMSVGTLRKRARERNWPPFYSKLEISSGTSERATLRRIIVKKLVHLEKRMDQPDTDTATDSERGSREYASLLTSVEKIDGKEATWRGAVISDTASITAQEAQPGQSQVAQWRIELAERITRLTIRQKT